MAPTAPIKAAEFFAGIGLVREALAPLQVNMVWANDIEQAKMLAYSANHGSAHFHLKDVRTVEASELPRGLELATSSFPCTDLSLAGDRAGLAGKQSGMFYEFARVLKDLGEDRPRVVLLENVHGFATSHGGADLAAALRMLSDLEYSCDVIAVDAKHFVPQSRPRMFIVGIRGELPDGTTREVPPVSDVRPAWVVKIHEQHRPHLRMHYLELPRLPEGPSDLSGVVQLLEKEDARWWDEDRLQRFLESLSPVQDARLSALRDAPSVSWRTAYRRTRNGLPVWELRADGIAGCLRTTGGGSSKQALVEAGRGEVRVRWMTPLEYARLMGAGSYKLLAGTPNQALFGFGDAVVVDVVRWIGEHYLVPALRPRTLATTSSISNAF